MLFKAIRLNVIQKRGKTDGKLQDIPQFGDQEGALKSHKAAKNRDGGEERERIDPKAKCKK